MLALLTDHWGLLLFRGGLAVVFGIFALTMPGPALATLILLFGAFLLVDGIVELAAAIGGRVHPDGWGMMLEGLLKIAAGVLTVVFPAMTALGLLALVAAWAIVTGAFAMVGAFQLRREMTGEWRLYAIGALSMLFGLLLIWNAEAGMLALVWVLGFYAVLAGGILISLAFKVQHLAHELKASIAVSEGRRTAREVPWLASSASISVRRTRSSR